jgi:hypothetical protein
MNFATVVAVDDGLGQPTITTTTTIAASLRVVPNRRTR